MSVSFQEIQYFLSGEGEQAKPLNTNTTREIERANKRAIQNEVKQFHTKKKINKIYLPIYQLLLEYSKNIFENIGKAKELQINYKKQTFFHV